MQKIDFISSSGPRGPILNGQGPQPFDMSLNQLDGMQILVVEDEMLVAADIEFALTDAGSAVIGPVASLAEAHALLRDDLPDAAILDVNLHGQDIYPVADILHRGGIPLVFHTGHADKTTLEKRFPGAQICLKPVLMPQLVSAVVHLLGR